MVDQRGADGDGCCDLPHTSLPTSKRMCPRLQTAPSAAPRIPASHPPTSAQLPQQRALLRRRVVCLCRFGGLRLLLLGLQAGLRRAGLAVPAAAGGRGKGGWAAFAVEFIRVVKRDEHAGQWLTATPRSAPPNPTPTQHTAPLTASPHRAASPQPTTPPHPNRPPPRCGAQRTTHQTMPLTASIMPANFLAVMVSPRKAHPPSSTRMVLLCPNTCRRSG